jgi:hypothetical protein
MDLSKVEILSNAVFRMGMMNIYENWLIVYMYIYMYTWKPNDPSFGWLTFHFMGQNLENKGHLGSRYIHIPSGNLT